MLLMNSAVILFLNMNLVAEKFKVLFKMIFIIACLDGTSTVGIQDFFTTVTSPCIDNNLTRCRFDVNFYIEIFVN